MVHCEVLQGHYHFTKYHQEIVFGDVSDSVQTVVLVTVGTNQALLFIS